MPSITTRKEFGEYCLRKLGHGLIQINISPAQVDDRVDEAIQIWNERHMDGSDETVVKHQVTAADKANGYIVLPQNVLRVESVLPIRSTGLGSGMFNIEYQLHLNDIFDLRAGGLSGRGGGISNFVMTKQYLNFLNDTLNGRNIVEFSRRRNRLEIQMDWENDIAEGEYIVMVVNLAVDPEEDGAYGLNDSWLKRYATALIELQWGQNLSKFSGVEMLGGVTFNGQDIIAKAKETIEKLEQELEDRYTPPPMFFVG